MAKLVARVGIWAVVLAAVLAGGSWCKRQLDVRRHPVESEVVRLLGRRLGGMTRDQRAMVRDLARQYPIQSMLAAHRSGWEGLERLRAKGPDITQQIQALAFKAGENGLDKEAAVEFTNASLSLLYALKEVDPEYADSILHAIHGLSPEERRNVAFDPSYVQIAPRLNAKYREEFRKNQDILTPLLAVTAPKDWKTIMSDFQAAQPRAGDIWRAPGLGESYALVYVLNRELVQSLEAHGVKEEEAISFLACNADTARRAKERDPSWAARVGRMREDSAPAADDGTAMSLFDWACNDPAVYRLVHEDPSPDREYSRKVLARYAGTDLPGVLRIQYSESPELLRAAIEALARFDNENDSNPDRRNAAAHFLCHYQNDGVFKDELRKHGAILIPALAAGGEEDLAKIKKNPHDLYKHVNKDGSPKGTPWWTWIPGGSISLVIHEIASGRTVTLGEWAWAAVDVAVLVPAVGQAGKLGRAGLKAIRSGLRAAGRSLGKSALRRETRALARAGIRKTSSRLLPRAAQVLWKAGRGVGKAVKRLSLEVAGVAAKHPVASLAAGIMIYSYANPDGARELFQNVLKRVGGPITEASQEAVKALAGLPGKLLASVWDEVHSQAEQHPMLAPIYYFWFALLGLLVIGLPVLALRALLRPAYDLLVSPLRHILKRARRSTKRPNTRTSA